MSKEKTGVVGVFYNDAAGDGYMEIDPERSHDGHYTLIEEFPYGGKKGDTLAEAKERADECLDGSLRNNLVAVFYDNSAGDAYWEDDPRGNFRGSGHHPFSCIKEYPYDPTKESSREQAIADAKNYTQQLTN